MAEFEVEWIGKLPDEGRELDNDSVYRRGAERLIERNSAGLIRVWYWANRLAASLPQVEGQLRRTAQLTRLAVGFIEELRGAFGVILYVEAASLLRRGDSTDEPGQGFRAEQSVRVDREEFPVFVRPMSVIQHWCTAPDVTHPSTARATCWVESRTRNYAGWLVPRHAVDSLSAHVGFSDGGTGHVIDHFGDCIDAVVVSTSAPPYPRTDGSRTRTCWPVVSGQTVLVAEKRGSHRPARVLDVDVNLGILKHAAFPIRFSIDWVGQPGQSGALLLEPGLSEPAGLYLGAITSLGGSPITAATPSQRGYAQTCYQLSEAAGLEFII